MSFTSTYLIRMRGRAAGCTQQCRSGYLPEDNVPAKTNGSYKSTSVNSNTPSPKCFSSHLFLIPLRRISSSTLLATLLMSLPSFVAFSSLTLAEP